MTCHALVSMSRGRETPMKTVKLPDKPSELLRLAMDDLAKCEGSKKYVVHMDIWHSGNVGLDKCLICLAGAVMSKTLGCPITEHSSLSYYSIRVANKLRAVNFFRKGDVNLALSCMQIKCLSFLNRRIIPYKDDPKLFRQDMNKLIRDLRKEGL